MFGNVSLMRMFLVLYGILSNTENNDKDMLWKWHTFFSLFCAKLY